MNIENRPSVCVQLGINKKAKPTIEMLIHRAREQCAVTAAGQKNLAFLRNDDAILKSPMSLDSDGNFSVEVEIPVEPQKPLIDHAPRKGRGLGMLMRNDDDEQLADKIVALVSKSAEHVLAVADILSVSDNPIHDIGRYEARNGCDTQSIRKFHYGAQESFAVDIEGEKILFEHQTIRARVTIAESLNASVLFPRSKDVLFKRGTILDVTDRPGGGGLMRGGSREFKFQNLQPIHHVLFSAARQLDIPIRLTTTEEVSTCTLNFRPHAVKSVANWSEISALLLEILRSTDLSRPTQSTNTALVEQGLTDEELPDSGYEDDLAA